VNKHTGRFCLIALILVAVVLGSSCHRSNTPIVKRYPFSGHVVSIDTQSISALVDGDAIPGFMDAMAMPYKVKPAATLSHLLPGDTISAEVVVVPRDTSNDDTEPAYWLENVRVTAHADTAPATAPNSLHMPEPGEEVPDFSFTNQDGNRISFNQYRGKTLLLTFIYTRCPFPDFCPRMSSNFAEIYKQVGGNPALSATQLLSISFDPEHDSPKVLRDYAHNVAHTQDVALFSRWQFATPSSGDLPKIANFFALTVKPEGGLITHNLSTAVIGPDGKIVKWYHGGDWQPSDLIKDVASSAPTKN
jgi:protein SCO1/2